LKIWFPNIHVLALLKIFGGSITKESTFDSIKDVLIVVVFFAIVLLVLGGLYLYYFNINLNVGKVHFSCIVENRNMVGKKRETNPP